MKIGQLIKILMESVRTEKVPADASVILVVPGVITTSMGTVLDTTFGIDSDLGKIDARIQDDILWSWGHGGNLRQKDGHTAKVMRERTPGLITFTKEATPVLALPDDEGVLWPNREKFIENAKDGTFLGHKVKEMSRNDLYYVIGWMSESTSGVFGTNKM